VEEVEGDDFGGKQSNQYQMDGAYTQGPPMGGYTMPADMSNMSANVTINSGYPMMPVNPQMGMYPPMAPSGFAQPGVQGSAVVVTHYNAPIQA
jgi:hypothetical protein